MEKVIGKMAEKEYIERESVLKCVAEDGRDCEYDLGYWKHNEEFQELIKAIPAVDVRPVVRGKWIWFGDCSNEGLYCSVCKNKIHEARNPKKKLSNFCPNCGADMREES